MKLTKRKSKQVNKSPVIFKKKPPVAAAKKRPKLRNLYALRRSKSKTEKKNSPSSRKNRKFISNGVRKAMLIAAKGAFPLVSAFVIYFGAQAVIQIRSEGVQQVAGVSFTNGEVVGFEEIPAFPGSEFIFEEHMEQPQVKQFLTDGFSVYRLPPSTSDDETYEYYIEALGMLEWEHVLSVSLAEDDKKHGEYWVKGNQGLRIYSQLNDVWYQKLTTEEAKTGLSEQVKDEVDRELLLASTEGSPLLPDYAWALTVPKEYLVTYYDTKIDEERGLQIKKIGSKDSVVIEPIGDADGQAMDILLQQFIDSYNLSQIENYQTLIAQENTKDIKPPANWEVVSSGYQSLYDRTTLISEISNGEELAKTYTVTNGRNKKVYTFTAFKSESQLLDFVLKNIKEKNSWY